MTSQDFILTEAKAGLYPEFQKTRRCQVIERPRRQVWWGMGRGYPSPQPTKQHKTTKL